MREAMEEIRKLYEIKEDLEKADLEAYRLEREAFRKREKKEYRKNALIQEREHIPKYLQRRNLPLEAGLLLCIVMVVAATLTNSDALKFNTNVSALEGETEGKIDDDGQLAQAGDMEKPDTVLKEVGQAVSAGEEKEIVKEEKKKKKEKKKEKNVIAVGDVVIFSGDTHYTSSYQSGASQRCNGGKAKVTRINQAGIHPYHLESAEKGCTVYGWVDAEDVAGVEE